MAGWLVGLVSFLTKTSHPRLAGWVGWSCSFGKTAGWVVGLGAKLGLLVHPRLLSVFPAREPRTFDRRRSQVNGASNPPGSPVTTSRDHRERAKSWFTRRSILARATSKADTAAGGHDPALRLRPPLALLLAEDAVKSWMWCPWRVTSSGSPQPCTVCAPWLNGGGSGACWRVGARARERERLVKRPDHASRFVRNAGSRRGSSRSQGSTRARTWTRSRPGPAGRMTAPRGTHGEMSRFASLPPSRSNASVGAAGVGAARASGLGAYKGVATWSYQPPVSS